MTGSPKCFGKQVRRQKKSGRMGNKRAAFRVIRWFQCSFWQGALAGETWPPVLTPCRCGCAGRVWRESRENSQGALGCPCVPTDLWDLPSPLPSPWICSPHKPTFAILPPVPSASLGQSQLCDSHLWLPARVSGKGLAPILWAMGLKVWVWERQGKWAQCMQGPAGAQVQLGFSVVNIWWCLL